MSDSILVALITGGLALAGVIVTSRQQAREIDHKLDKQQAVMETKLEVLTSEVREHNNFAKRVPILETELKNLAIRIEMLERKFNHD